MHQSCPKCLLCPPVSHTCWKTIHTWLRSSVNIKHIISRGGKVLLFLNKNREAHFPWCLWRFSLCLYLYCVAVCRVSVAILFSFHFQCYFANCTVRMMKIKQRQDSLLLVLARSGSVIKVWSGMVRRQSRSQMSWTVLKFGMSSMNIRASTKQQSPHSCRIMPMSLPSLLFALYQLFSLFFFFKGKYDQHFF